MSFFKKIFGSGKSEESTPSYSSFEEGDIFYTNSNGQFSFFKVIKVDDADNTLHVMMYEPCIELPKNDAIKELQVMVYHAPIDRNGFENPKLFAKTVLEDGDFMGYHEYLKQTRDFKAIAANAKKYYQSAHRLSTEGDHQGAIDKYSIAINLLPNFFEAIDNRAFSKMDLGLWSDAIDDFEQSLQVNPNSLLAVFSIAECYLRMNNYDNAIVYLERANGIDPTNEKVKEFLRYAKDKLNRQ